MNIITELSQRKRLIIIGDIHGDISVLCSCLYMTKVINNNMEWIAEPQDTVVIQMGDQVDGLSRNDNDTENWEQIEDTKILTFTERLDSIAKEKGGRFISLLGNHELMNVFGDFSYVSNNSMIKTGGELNRKYLFKPGSKYSKILATRPIILKIGKLLFCHAGLLMKHLKLVNNNLETINILSNKYLNDIPLTITEQEKFFSIIMSENGIIWNRHYLEPLRSNCNIEPYFNELTDVLTNTDCHAMIIGHNPMNSITQLYNGKLWVVDVGLSKSFKDNSNIELLEIIDGVEVNIIKKL
jgi:hypothetical protein